MIKKKSRGFGWLLEQAKTLKERIYDYENLSGNKCDKKHIKVLREELVSVGLVEQLREQFKDLIDTIPIDMQKAGRKYEVYSVGTKRQWIDWFIHYNEVLGSGKGEN